MFLSGELWVWRLHLTCISSAPFPRSRRLRLSGSARPPALAGTPARPAPVGAAWTRCSGPSPPCSWAWVLPVRPLGLWCTAPGALPPRSGCCNHQTTDRPRSSPVAGQARQSPRPFSLSPVKIHGGVSNLPFLSLPQRLLPPTLKWLELWK